MKDAEVMDEAKRRAWAEFRFAVIAPLVCRRLDEAERRSLKRQILSNYYRTPDGTEKLIAERTLRTWIVRYRQYGFDGLLRMRSRTAGRYYAIPEEIIDEAEKLRIERRDRSIRVILSLLKARGMNVEGVSKTTLNFHLNRRGATKEKYASEKGTFQRFQKEHANDMWQSDTTGGVWLPDPLNRAQVKQTRLILFIDDATRVITHAEFYWDEQLPSLIDCFRKALLKRGRSRMLFCDNGHVYHAKALKRACTQLGIEFIHAQEYCPEGKGKIERHIGTVKSSFYGEANSAGLTTLEDLNKFFFAWLAAEYHGTRHSALGMTPLERFALDEEKGFVQPVMPEDIRRALMLIEERKVNSKTATIQLNNRTYQVSQELAGKTVEVLWEADKRVDTVEIWLDGKLVEIASEIVPGSNIDFEKRPDRQRKPAGKSVVLESSKRYRQALEAAYKQEVVYKRSDYLAEPEFEKLFASMLARELTPEEQTYLSATFAQLSPLTDSATETILKRAINAKGTNMHLRYYCDLLKQAKVLHKGGNK